MTDRTGLARALGVGLFGIAVATAGTALAGCSTQAPGSASFTVTYTPDDGGNPITETVTMDTTDCDASTSTHLWFGEDVSIDAQADYMHHVKDDPASVRGYLPGVVSGLVDFGQPGAAYLVILLPGGVQFYSIEPFEADRDGFSVTDHPGQVVIGGIWTEAQVIATTATATGTFTC